jgi:hypothetical protein
MKRLTNIPARFRVGVRPPETSIHQNYIPDTKAASKPYRRITVGLGKTAYRGRIVGRSTLERQQSATLLTIPDSRRIRSPDKKHSIYLG